MDLAGDAGDFLTGGAGLDSFTIQVNGAPDDFATVTDFNATQGAFERITLIDSTGVPLTPAQIAAEVTVISGPDGDALITVGDIPVALIEGVTAAQLANQSLWLNNLTL